MIKGKTKSGFNYAISQERMENYEMIEVLNELDENPMKLPKVINLLLGNDGAKRLKDHVRTDDGIVPSKVMMNEIEEIFESHKQTKN